MQAVDLAALTRRSEADAALARRCPSRRVRAFLLQSLAFDDGRAAWKLNLAGARRRRCRGSWASPTSAPRFAGPTLFLTGAASDYVRPAHWPRIRALFPAAPSTASSPAPATGCTPRRPPPSSTPSRHFSTRDGQTQPLDARGNRIAMGSARRR